MPGYLLVLSGYTVWKPQAAMRETLTQARQAREAS